MMMSDALLHSFALLSCGKSWETTPLLAIVDGLNEDLTHLMGIFTRSSVEYSHLTVSLTWVCPSTKVAATERSIFSPLNVRFSTWYCPLPEGAKKKHHKTKQITSCNVLQHPNLKRRCRCRINTGRFPKRAPKARKFLRRGVREHAPQGKVLDFKSPKSPFQGFWAIQTGYLLTV